MTTEEPAEPAPEELKEEKNDQSELPSPSFDGKGNGLSKWIISQLKYQVF